jgi:hypothetical protein
MQREMDLKKIKPSTFPFLLLSLLLFTNLPIDLPPPKPQPTMKFSLLATALAVLFTTAQATVLHATPENPQCKKVGGKALPCPNLACFPF